MVSRAELHDGIVYLITDRGALWRVRTNAVGQPELEHACEHVDWPDLAIAYARDEDRR